MTPGEQTTEFQLAILALAALCLTALFAQPGSQLEKACVEGIGYVVGGYGISRGLAKVGHKP